MKPLKVSQLELSADAYGVKVETTVKGDQPNGFHKVWHRTRPTIVLYCVANTSSGLSTFMANRLGAVRECTIPAHWRHVQPEDSTAGPASRFW